MRTDFDKATIDEDVDGFRSSILRGLARRYLRFSDQLNGVLDAKYLFFPADRRIFDLIPKVARASRVFDLACTLAELTGRFSINDRCCVEGIRKSALDSFADIVKGKRIVIEHSEMGIISKPLLSRTHRSVDWLKGQSERLRRASFDHTHT